MSYPIYLGIPRAIQHLNKLMSKEKGKAYSTVSHCYLVSLPCSIQYLLSPKPKQIPPEILSILPALAPALGDTCWQPNISAAKWKRLML